MLGLIEELAVLDRERWLGSFAARPIPLSKNKIASTPLERWKVEYSGISCGKSTSRRLHCHQPFLYLNSLNAAGLANIWLPLKSIALPGPPRQGLKALHCHTTFAQPATTTNTTPSETAGIHVALLTSILTW